MPKAGGKASKVGRSSTLKPKGQSTVKQAKRRNGRNKCNLNSIRLTYTDPVLPEGLTRKGRLINSKYNKAKLLAKDMVELKNLLTEITVETTDLEIKSKMNAALTTFGISICVIKASIEMYEDMEKCPLGTITRMIGEEYPTVRKTLIKLSRCVRQIKNV